MSTSNKNTTIAYGDNAVALLNPNEIAVIRCKSLRPQTLHHRKGGRIIWQQ